MVQAALVIMLQVALVEVVAAEAVVVEMMPAQGTAAQAATDASFFTTNL
jgi:hypothetical protein